MGRVGTGLGLYVGNLQVLWGVLERDWGSMLATCMFYWLCWSQFGAVCWQPTGSWQPACFMGCVGASLGLYVGNLQVAWGVLERVWGCMLATYIQVWWVCWSQFGAVRWQPTCLIGRFGAVGWQPTGSMLATYRSYAVCWNGFGAVCWQPTGLMGRVGTGLGQYVGNLQDAWGVFGPFWGSMLATHRSQLISQHPIIFSTPWFLKLWAKGLLYTLHSSTNHQVQLICSLLLAETQRLFCSVVIFTAHNRASQMNRQILVPAKDTEKVRFITSSVWFYFQYLFHDDPTNSDTSH